MPMTSEYAFVANKNEIVETWFCKLTKKSLIRQNKVILKIEFELKSKQWPFVRKFSKCRYSTVFPNSSKCSHLPKTPSYIFSCYLPNLQNWPSIFLILTSKLSKCKYSTVFPNSSEYSQTWPNGHLQITATCQQRPGWSHNGQSKAYFFRQPSL